MNKVPSNAKKIYSWLMTGVYERELSKDTELEALRRQMRQEFIQMRDRGLPIRIVSV